MPEKMTPKEFLLQYRDADEAINLKLDQINRLRELATKTTQTLSDARVKSSGEQDKLATIVGKIVDMEEEVDADIDNLQKIKCQVEEAVAKVPNAKQRSVLARRYINGDPWPRICTSLFGGRSDFQDRFDSYLRTIYRWHGYALENLANVIDCHYERVV